MPAERNSRNHQIPFLQMEKLRPRQGWAQGICGRDQAGGMPRSLCTLLHKETLRTCVEERVRRRKDDRAMAGLLGWGRASKRQRSAPGRTARFSILSHVLAGCGSGEGCILSRRLPPSLPCFLLSSSPFLLGGLYSKLDFRPRDLENDIMK